MSGRPVYGPWRLPGHWGLRILAPKPGEALPVVERDWAPGSVVEGHPDEDWRLEKSATASEVAAELVRVAGERDRAVKAAAEAGLMLEQCQHLLKEAASACRREDGEYAWSSAQHADYESLAGELALCVAAIESVRKLIHAVIGAPDAAEEE